MSQSARSVLEVVLRDHRTRTRTRLDALLRSKEPVTVAELAALVAADRDLTDRIEDLDRAPAAGAGRS